jgi:hypothetical protein
MFVKIENVTFMDAVPAAMNILFGWTTSHGGFGKRRGRSDCPTRR